MTTLSARLSAHVPLIRWTSCSEDVPGQIRIQSGFGLPRVGRVLARRLKAAAADAVRCQAAIPGGPATAIEFHFGFEPYRRHDSMVAEIPALTATIDGAIYAQSPSEYQCRLLCAGHALPGEPGMYFRFQHVQPMDARQAGFLLKPLCRLYRLEGNLDPWIESQEGQLEAAILLRLRAEAALSWAGLAEEKSGAFFEQIRDVSTAIQTALRKWIAYVYFEPVDRFLVRGEAFPVLIYSALRVFKGRRRGEYTYDVLDNPGCLMKQIRLSGVSLSEQYQCVQERLRQAGVPRLIRFRYARRNGPRDVAVLRQPPRALSALLVAEEWIAQCFHRLGLALSNPSEPVGARTTGSWLHHKLGSILRRACPPHSFHFLVPLLILEATAALAAHRNRPVPIEALLRLRNPATGEEFWMRNSHFSR